MVRTLVFTLLGFVALGVVATPGLALIGVLFFPFLLIGAIAWWMALAMTTDRRPSQAVVRTARHRFLGPGGPDDPFADELYEEDVDLEPVRDRSTSPEVES